MNKHITLDELEAMSTDELAERAELDEGAPWRITDDSTADWAVAKIAAAREELARIEALASEQFDRIQSKVEEAKKRCESATGFLTSKLAEYFETVPHKETKTKHSYRLLSGTLAKKIGGATMRPDEARLLAHLKASGQEDFVKVEEKPRWGEYKKRLEIVNGAVIDTETGELVDGVDIEEKPDSFVIEI